MRQNESENVVWMGLGGLMAVGSFVGPATTESLLFFLVGTGLFVYNTVVLIADTKTRNTEINRSAEKAEQEWLIKNQPRSK